MTSILLIPDPTIETNVPRPPVVQQEHLGEVVQAQSAVNTVLRGLNRSGVGFNHLIKDFVTRGNNKWF